MRPRLAVVVVTALVSLGACSDGDPGPVGGDTGEAVGRRGLTAAQVEERVRPLLEDELAAEVDALTCSGLAAGTARATTCRAEVDGREVEVAVTASEAGPSGELAISVTEPGATPATEPDPDPAAPGTTEPAASSTTVVDGRSVPVVAPDALARQLAVSLGEEVGAEAPPVTCAEPLVGVVGRTGRCVVEEGSQRFAVTVRVTGVEGLDVAFAYEVADEPSR